MAIKKTFGVWITHDIDHIRIKEHFRDLFIFRFIGVCLVEMMKGRRNVFDYTRAKYIAFRPNAFEHFDPSR